MKINDIILLAEDEAGHATLIKKNLKRAGIENDILHFHDGQNILDFLYKKTKDPQFKEDTAYLLLLDIRMPKVDGIDVLKQLKQHQELKKIPVIMLTTTDEPNEIRLCHEVGCNGYITKPIDYNQFVKTIQQLGLFLSIAEIPKVYENVEDKSFNNFLN